MTPCTILSVIVFAMVSILPLISVMARVVSFVVWSLPNLDWTLTVRLISAVLSDR